MTLSDLIARLENTDPTLTLRPGFTNPHSYRGYYEELAVEPTESCTVADLLQEMRGALGTTYQGWKGGDFTMDESTTVYVAHEGSTGEEFSSLALDLIIERAERRSTS